jgi:curli biogenesis system outer membrane secretion channel CsgG
MSRVKAVPVLVMLLIAAAQAQTKKRVAVLDFDYATVKSTVAALFGTNQDVGKGISDMLVDRLVQDGVYSVIERNAINKVLNEQNFANSDRADASTAAKIGRVLGVDAIIIGSITQFGRDDKKNTVGGGAMTRGLGRLGIGGVERTQSTAVVQITARMVDASTAEILASMAGKGEETRSGTGILGAGGSNAGLAAGALDMRTKNFGATILGAAVNKAVTEVAVGLEQKSASLPTTVAQIDGLVADVSPDGTLIINVGSKAGVKVGDRLQVKRYGREVRDPATNKVLRRMEDLLGTMTVTEVDANSAVGKYSGATMPKVGDGVTNPK